MRVLIIGINFEPEAAGIAPYTSGIAHGLSSRGHEVRVLTGYPHYPQWKVHQGYAGLSTVERAGDTHLKRLRHYVPQRPTMLKRLLMEVTFGLRAVASSWARPDVVVLVSPALVASFMSSLRARLTGVPVVTWVQDIYTLGVEQTEGRSATAVRAVERRLLQGSSRVVAIHDRFRTYLHAELGVTSPIDVVRNWSHVEPAPPFDRAEVRRLHGWGDEEIIALHAGNMGAKQGLENVVAASRVAADRGSRVRFVLMGDGLRRRELQKLDPNPRLQFLEPVPDGLFEQTLAAADVLLVNELPGLTEMSVPSKLTTYWATGRPVVAAVDRASTTAEEISVSGAGLLVEPAAPGELVEAIEDLVADPDRCLKLGAAGEAFRLQRLSPEAGLNAFEAVLRGA
jgi:colanic acid biosynthesis glycosyl transferase WcaI